MANGRLGVSAPLANTENFLYQVPSTSTASVSITACNTNGTSAKIRLSIENSSAVGIATTNCIEYNTTVPASSSLERGGIVLSNQQKLFCYSDVGGVNFVVYGYES